MGKKVLIVLGAIAMLIIVAVASTVGKMKKELYTIDLTPVDISKVSDGVYEGTSETQLVKVKVQVTVKDGSMQIEILNHDCGKGKPAEAIVPVMSSLGTVEVDAVTGATVSSEVIKDAVRNALRKGLQE